MTRIWFRLVCGIFALTLLLWPHASHATGPLPGLWATPLELDFGPIGVGLTSAPQVVTIANTGSTTLTNFAGGAPFDTQFGATQNCAGGVAPGASCQYTFSFTPTATGVVSTTSDSSTNAGRLVIRLRGEGVGPKLSVSPLELDFGDVPLNTTSAPQVVAIRNTGLARLANFAGGAPFNTQFGATQNCASGVAPGASCQYSFTFKPTTLGVAGTTSNSGTNAGSFVIKLKGNGTNGGAVTGPKLVFSPLELDFGPVGVGATSAPQVVTIKNIGNATLTDFAGGAPFNTQFGATQDCAGGVAPGASCQFTFTFKPTATGVVSTTSDSSTNAGRLVIKLRGEGVGPKLSVSPLELDFGDVPLNTTSVPQVVTIRNTGLARLTNFAGGAPFNTQFGATQDCAGGIAPGASCQFTFTFKPTATGVFSTTSDSSTNAGPLIIKLRGQSGTVPPSPRLSFEPSQVAPYDVTRLNLTLNNLNRTSVIDDVLLSISLPTGIEVATTPQASTTGCGAATLAANPGANTVGLMGARIGRDDRCQVSVNIKAVTAGSYTISTGVISSSNGGGSSGTSAVLQVTTPELKAFLPLMQK